MNKRIILTASFFGALAVVLGAFGAHGLKPLLDESSLQAWQKGVEYQFYHVFALLYLSTFARYKNKLIQSSFISFTLGILFFSGSLFGITWCKLSGAISVIRILGPLTPVGGICLIFGWIFLFLAALKDK